MNSTKINPSRYFSLICFSLLAYSLYSQEISYGVGGGPTVSTLAKIPFRDATSTQGELGFMLYAFGEIPISDNIRFHGKLAYDKRVVNTFAPINTFLDINLLSLMPSVKIDMGGTRAGAGVFFKSGLRISNVFSAEDTENAIDVSDGFKSINLGFNLGFGVDFAKHYSFEVLFDFGITNEIENPDEDRRLHSVMFLLEVDLASLLKKSKG